MRKNPKHSVQMIFRKRIDFIIFLTLCLFITKPSKGDLTKAVDNQLGEMGDIGVLPEQKKKRLMNFIIGDKDRNCLLYTSPSPRDMRRSRMPSSA